jgi:hypothetical protein
VYYRSPYDTQELFSLKAAYVLIGGREVLSKGAILCLTQSLSLTTHGSLLAGDDIRNWFAIVTVALSVVVITRHIWNIITLTSGAQTVDKACQEFDVIKSIVLVQKFPHLFSSLPSRINGLDEIDSSCSGPSPIALWADSSVTFETEALVLLVETVSCGVLLELSSVPLSHLSFVSFCKAR